ncbi:MAG TPA: hypothetical protein VN829_04505, partial [Dongiaceae bacterium]|nr:hypothetical protein [Dongiaceae bacterium]
MKSFSLADRVSVAILVVTLLATAGCSSPGGSSGHPADRAALRNALRTSGVLEKGRQLVHLSQIGNLEVEGQSFPVVDIMELVPGASTPRGINRIVVLDAALAPVQQIEYTTERPLFCKGNRLFLW